MRKIPQKIHISGQNLPTLKHFNTYNVFMEIRFSYLYFSQASGVQKKCFVI